eukprot:9790-Heterococcus_DN1.PRE.7
MACEMISSAQDQAKQLIYSSLTTSAHTTAPLAELLCALLTAELSVRTKYAAVYAMSMSTP